MFYIVKKTTYNQTKSNLFHNNLIKISSYKNYKFTTQLNLPNKFSKALQHSILKLIDLYLLAKLHQRGNKDKSPLELKNLQTSPYWMFMTCLHFDKPKNGY